MIHIIIVFIKVDSAFSPLFPFFVLDFYKLPNLLCLQGDKSTFIVLFSLLKDRIYKLNQFSLFQLR